MAAPAAQLRKHLSAPGLLGAIRQTFEVIPDQRCSPLIPLASALMSGLAVFGLKYLPLLKFDEAYSAQATLRHNLRTLYGVAHAPCDTPLRTILDPLEPRSLCPAFRAVHRAVQRAKALEAYEYLDDHYLLSVDGTRQYASSAIGCAECCVKHQGQANASYYSPGH